MTLLYLSVAWLLGIWLGSVLRWSPEHFLWLGLPSAGGLFLRRRDLRLRLLCACSLVLVAGAVRFSLSIPHFDEGAIAYYNGREEVTVRGLVAGEPDIRDRHINLRLRTRELLVDDRWRGVKGDVLVQVDRYPGYRYGDLLEVQGHLETPPVFEDFSYKDYLAARGIHGMMRRPSVQLLAKGQGNPVYAAIYALKARAQATIAVILPEPEASLLTGILLGYERGIPQRVADAFARTNTAHVIAISGYNITLIAGLLTWMARRLVGVRWATPVVLVGLAVYTVLVGAYPAVVRAAVMGGLYVLAVHFGRQTESLISLGVAGFLMTLHTPLILWEPAFQLSFAATLALMVLVPPLQAGFEQLLSRVVARERAKTASRFLNDALIVTFAAQLATTPILVHVVHRFSMVGLLVNFLILPAQPGVMLAGGAATIAGLIWLPMGRLLGAVAYLFLTYTIRVVELMATLPWAAVRVGQLPMVVYAGYYGLLGAVVALSRLDRSQLRAAWQALTAHLNTKLSLAGLSLAGALVWTAALSTPDGLLHVAFLDVGQGDAIFVQTPGGAQLVIDGGPSPSTMAAEVGRRMPFWDRSLELVVMTHPDEDHFAGLLPLLERYRVGQVLEPGVRDDTTFYRQWERLIETGRVPVAAARAGTRIALDDGVWAEVFNPPDPLPSAEASDNTNSVVLRLGYGQVTFLLTGDLDAEGEERLLRQGADLRSAVLKVSHHGSRAGTTRAFLAAVQPVVAVISVGADNRFGHPAPEVLERLSSVPVYRTDQHGTVEFVTDGRRLWVRTK
jgi:competence protein ComEC